MSFLVSLTMNLFEYLLYLLFGRRFGGGSEPAPPVSQEEVDEMEELVRDTEPEGEEYEGEEGAAFRRNTDELEVLSERDTGETETPDGFWKRLLG